MKKYQLNFNFKYNKISKIIIYLIFKIPIYFLYIYNK